MTYGYLDKVIAVERNGEVTRFDYDAQGMLVGKQLPDGSYEHWTWDGIRLHREFSDDVGAWHLDIGDAEDSLSSDRVTAGQVALVARGEERYINEGHITGGLPLISETEEGVLYHQHDHLGTTVASYTVDGEIAKTYQSTVYGEGELENSPSARFTGKPYDADLGAYVFPFRNYDPEAARWLSADPSGFPDGPNNHFYAAVPTMGVDPFGLAKLSYNNHDYTFTVNGTSNLTSVPQAHQNLINGLSSFTIDYALPTPLAGSITVNNGGAEGDISHQSGARLAGLNADFSSNSLSGHSVFWVQLRDSNVGTSQQRPAGLIFDGVSSGNVFTDQPSRYLDSATQGSPVNWTGYTYLFGLDGTDLVFAGAGVQWGFSIEY